MILSKHVAISVKKISKIKQYVICKLNNQSYVTQGKAKKNYVIISIILVKYSN